MEKKSKGSRKDPRHGRPVRDNATQDGDGAFDNWLENKLRTAYSSVLDEPVPEDLIRLLHQKFKD